MTPFEEELKRALSRREPSEDFAARLFEKAAAEKPRNILQSLAYWRLAAAVALLAIVGWSLLYRQHVREARGEAAKRQLLVAMRIAGTELREAQVRVKRLEFPEVMQ